MKRVVLILLSIIFSTIAFSQDLTGVWKGYFYSGLGPFRQYYKYEVQIDNLSNNSLKGVTYSYRTTVFYGKADMQGIWFAKTKSILLKELKLIELKMEAGSQACAMTCNLTYSKEGGKEILSGDFTSININDKKDCGSGTVYLERVPVSQSDFGPEPFLLKKKTTPKIVDSTAQKKPAAKPPVTNSAATKKPVVKPPVTNNNTASKKPVAKPPVTNNNTAKKPAPQPVTQNKNNTAQKKTPPPPPVTQIRKDTAVAIQPIDKKPVLSDTSVKKKLPPVPAIMRTRSNPLIKTIITNSPDIKVELYDNGDIDGDTITVYHNNEVIAWKKGLSAKPITINVKASTADPEHEFVMVADNLGSIPPNTALMVITSGGKRYEVYISSDNKKNAKVAVEYKP